MSSRRKQTFKKSAANAVQQAIRDATAELQAELDAAHREVARLRGVLANVVGVAQQGIGDAAVPAAVKAPAPKMPEGLRTIVEEIPPEENAGQSVPLNDGDIHGEGRWI